MRRLRAVVGLVIGLGAALALLRRLDAVEVTGSSMVPSVRPGDRLLVESLSYAGRAPRRGEVVLAADPRDPSRELIKRVVSVHGALVELRGDAPLGSTDSRAFGPVPSASVRWRAILRYWPPARVSRI